LRLAVDSAAAAVLGLLASRIDPDPIDPCGAGRLADEYDERLARELSLGAAAEDGAADAPHVAFGIAPGAGAGMATLTVAF
jgi:hypothetical protein